MLNSAFDYFDIERDGFDLAYFPGEDGREYSNDSQPLRTCG